jgi:AAA domain-containing protein
MNVTPEMSAVERAEKRAREAKEAAEKFNQEVAAASAPSPGESAPEVKPNGSSTSKEIAEAKQVDREATSGEVAVAEEPVEPERADEENDGPLTEREAIQLVKQWAALDEEVDSSERESFEEMLKNLKEAAKLRTSSLSTSRLEEIISTYAPNAPRALNAHNDHPYPPELAALVNSGIVKFDGYWLVNRCYGCGQFPKNECCGRVMAVSAVRGDGQTLTSYGRQAAGLDPIRPPKPPQSEEQILQEKMANIQNEPCWNQFRGVGELEGNGTVKMYIENFLPEGATIICGLPKEGKSYLALSVAKALTTGKPLFGKQGFEVPEIVPVLYLAAESGDSALKLRCKKFNITEDKTRFLARTLTQGVMLGLNSPEIESILKAMHPVVVLETLIRFNDGKDEDDASENKKLAEAIFHLIALGARAVIGIHHSRKDVKANPTKEAAVRGSGDALAMVDAVWLVLQDERLFQGGKGPNEIDVIGWGRDFNPVSMRLALTKKAPKNPPSNALTYAPGIISCIDSGDLMWVDRQEQRQDLSQMIEDLISKEPSISREKLVEETGATEWEVKTTLKHLRYYRPKGGKKGAGPWEKKPA